MNEKERKTSQIPPLVLKPRWLHDKSRALEIVKAFEKSLESGGDIPGEWIKEFDELCAIRKRDRSM